MFGCLLLLRGLMQGCVCPVVAGGGGGGGVQSLLGCHCARVCWEVCLSDFYHSYISVYFMFPLSCALDLCLLLPPPLSSLLLPHPSSRPSSMLSDVGPSIFDLWDVQLAQLSQPNYTCPLRSSPISQSLHSVLLSSSSSSFSLHHCIFAQLKFSAWEHSASWVTPDKVMLKIEA